MYSKAKGITEQSPAVPPGYRGNRFSGGSVTEMPVRVRVSETPRRAPELTELIKSVDREELLIMALITVLAGEGRAEGESILMLVLLLLIR